MSFLLFYETTIMCKPNNLIAVRVLTSVAWKKKPLLLLVGRFVAVLCHAKGYKSFNYLFLFREKNHLFLYKEVGIAFPGTA